MKFFIKDFLSKCDQIRRKMRIWSHLLTKPLLENFIFCAVHGRSILKLFHVLPTCFLTKIKTKRNYQHGI